MKNDRTLIKLKIDELCKNDKVLNKFILELVDFESGKGGRYKKKYKKIIETYLENWSDEDED